MIIVGAQDMSALGHKRIYAVQKGMSAKCQKQTSPASFNHLVDAGEQRWWHSQVECLRRFEIDDHFVFCRYLDRHIPGFSPLRIRST